MTITVTLTDGSRLTGAIICAMPWMMDGVRALLLDGGGELHALYFPQVKNHLVDVASVQVNKL